MSAGLGESAFWVMTVLAEGRRHGYAIVREVDERSGKAMQMKATTLYAVLDRLADEGLVASAGDETVEGRPADVPWRCPSRAGADTLAARTRAARASLTRLRPTEAGA